MKVRILVDFFKVGNEKTNTVSKPMLFALPTVRQLAW